MSNLFHAPFPMITKLESNAPLKLGKRQQACLKLIDKYGGSLIGDLNAVYNADNVKMPLSHFREMVNRLGVHGFVENKGDAGVHLTDAGKNKLHEF